MAAFASAETQRAGMLPTSPPPLALSAALPLGQSLSTIVAIGKVTRPSGSLKEDHPGSDYLQHARSAGRDPP
jgi:hypothetical protein